MQVRDAFSQALRLQPPLLLVLLELAPQPLQQLPLLDPLPQQLLLLTQVSSLAQQIPSRVVHNTPKDLLALFTQPESHQGSALLSGSNAEHHLQQH